jgi:hypothetical protein
VFVQGGLDMAFRFELTAEKQPRQYKADQRASYANAKNIPHRANLHGLTRFGGSLLDWTLFH